MPGGSGSEEAPEPWHVPEVADDALSEALPPPVVDAAKRAFTARRAGATVAELVEEIQDEHGRRCRFADGNVSIEMRVVPVDVLFRVRVTCPDWRGCAADVLHGGSTISTTLDARGDLEVDVLPGLFSVVIHAPGSAVPAVQTMWLRLR